MRTQLNKCDKRNGKQWKLDNTTNMTHTETLWSSFDPRVGIACPSCSTNHRRNDAAANAAAATAIKKPITIRNPPTAQIAPQLRRMHAFTFPFPFLPAPVLKFSRGVFRRCHCKSAWNAFRTHNMRLSTQFTAHGRNRFVDIIECGTMHTQSEQNGTGRFVIDCWESARPTYPVNDNFHTRAVGVLVSYHHRCECIFQ